MLRPTALAATRRDIQHSSRVPFLELSLALLALASLAAGVAALVLHARLEVSQHVLAPAGILLVVCSCVQWRTAWRLWSHPGRFERVAAPSGWAFCRRLAVGAFAAHAVAMSVGPLPYLTVAFATALMVWITVLIMPLAASPRLSEQWRRWTQRPGVRRVSRVAFVAMLVLLASEAGLQGFKLVRQQGWLAGGPKIPPREQIVLAPPLIRDGKPVAGSTAQLTPGPFRVAVLVDPPGAQGSEYRQFMSRVEQSLPGIKIVPLDLPQPWATRPTAEISAQLAAARPDLVLAMLSICEDLTREAAAPGWFDWRQCELVRLVAGTPAAAPASQSNRAESFESLLGGLAPQLAACRTPIDDTMRSRWQRTFDALEDLVADCRASKLPVTLVLVPGEFQVNRSLCDTLTRRAGYAAEQVDVELPQRKLTCFAERRQVPIIDLLPSLRLCHQPAYERNAAVWSDAGHEAAAGAIGGWLESKYGRQLAVAAQLTVAP